MIDRAFLTNRHPDLDIAKLEQVLLYLLQNANNEHLGKVKLMKLLYYIDFDHFERYDRPVTGASYMKFAHGPVPQDVDLLLRIMQQEGKIEIEHVPAFNYLRTKYTAHVEPDFGLLDHEERETVARVAGKWEDFSMRQIVDATHNEAPWLGVALGEEIPYHLAYYRNTFGELTDQPSDDQPLQDEEAVFSHYSSSHP